MLVISIGITDIGSFQINTLAGACKLIYELMRDEGNALS
ncbi:protein of unknown function [Shewanella benthica]|uniref:Uncharacterized protein n=1 Tax=Shewanella benthica TaxID=43661 RepID=A0A330M690_9GAMM|nr:protein of unknown function [Shewanella benthica]